MTREELLEIRDRWSGGSSDDDKDELGKALDQAVRELEASEQKSDAAKGLAYRGTYIARTLARVVLDNRPTPDKRWPRWSCGRASKTAPLRGLEVKTEDGKTYFTGCHLCTSEHVADAARKVLGEEG